jgi:homoserine O-acetyltransferase
VEPGTGIGGFTRAHAAAPGCFTVVVHALLTAFRRHRSEPQRDDANDVLYQYESSRDYSASAGLEKIQAELMAINSADDERNPAELGILEREIKRVKKGRVLMIPASDQTAGHATAYFARHWKKEVAELLQMAPRLGK